MREPLYFDDFQTFDGGDGILIPTDAVLPAETAATTTGATQTTATPNGNTTASPTIARYNTPGARAKQEAIIKGNTPETPAPFEITGTHLLIGAAVLGLILYSLDD